MALPRFPSSFLALLVVVLAAIVSGCQPKIGDSCVLDQDCTAETARLCDTTQPYGYCTMVDCDPTTCPEEEAICVSFNNVRSTVGACNTPVVPSPYRRNFCMKFCEDDSDCRDDYQCIEVNDGNIFGAAVIQEEPENGDPVPNKICIHAEAHPAIDSDHPDEVCTGYLGAAGADNSGE